VTKNRAFELQRLNSVFERLAGAAITKISAGGAAGSIIGIELDRPTSGDQPSPRPEWYIGIECSWRLEVAERPMTSSLDDNSEGGPMLSALRFLLGCTVSAISASAPSFDLSISLNRDARLVVFCDVIQSGICWYMLGPDGLEISVEPAGMLQGLGGFDVL
jgi:hypothetical protein